MNGFKRGYTPTEKQRAWWRSPRFKEISRRSIIAWNAGQTKMQKCGAKRRTDGGECRNLALENGRCRFHGGRVPKGKGWHLHQWPTSGSDQTAKTARKLKDAARKARQREKRLAAMTPEQRAAHEAWHKAHCPTVSPGERARRRALKRQAAEAGALLMNPRERQPSPEAQALAREIEALKRRQRQLEVERAIRNREGVFG